MYGAEALDYFSEHSTGAATPAYQHRSFENHASFAQPIEGNSMNRFRGRSTGNLSGNSAGNFSAESTKPRAFRVTQREWRELSSQAWHDFAGNRPGAAKFIAEEIECSPKTAQSWLDGESTPAGILDMRAMSRNPIYAALKREIAGMQTDLDPRLQAKYQELHRLTLELAGGT